MKSMTLDILIGGMPRGGTTVAAKLMSLHPDIFCYAGETHLIPFMYSMFSHLPCRPDKVELVTRYLRHQFMTAMVEMPRFSVSQGAHPRNLIFNEQTVNDLIEAVRSHLNAGLYGEALYKASLTTMAEMLSIVDARNIRGEKTPSNIFAMAEYAEVNAARNVIVIREPIGVLRSMKARVDGGDPYSAVFRGDLEATIGMYLEYAMAVQRVLSSSPSGFMIRYEDMALNPAQLMRDIFRCYGSEPEDRVIRFVEKGGDKEIADRAPMNYRRLALSADYGDLSPVDIWKIFALTREVRNAVGYSDETMESWGFKIPSDWPDVDVPSAVLPLYGFHQKGLIGGPLMKRHGGLIVYVPRGSSYDLVLTLKSTFPDQAETGVNLSVTVNSNARDIITVESGRRVTYITLAIHKDDLIPMGNRGGYAIIDLKSSLSYCKIGHEAHGDDAREVSFTLDHWKLNRRPSRWRQLFGIISQKGTTN